MISKRSNLKTNHRPVNLLRSWLRYQSIPFADGLAPPTDLVVGTPPEQKCVHVTTGPQDLGPRLEEPLGMNLNGELLCYGSQYEVRQEFWRLLSAIGIQEKLRPFERGSFFEDREGRRVSARKDGDELIFLRHNAFERSPNPSKEQVAIYENTVGMVTKLYWRRNRVPLQALGYEFQEILTYAWVWTVSYIANYETRPAEGGDNQRLLFSFLRQCFRFLWQNRHALQYSTLRAAPGDLQAALGIPMASLCRQRGHSGGMGTLFPSVEELGIPLELQLPPREAATLRLEERLAELPHDEVIRRLQAAARAIDALEKDVRLLARQNLVEHVRACQTCKDRGFQVEKWCRGHERPVTDGTRRRRKSDASEPVPQP